MFWTITHSFINWMHFNIFIWNLCAMESTYQTLLISSFRIYGHAHTLAINKNMNIRQNNCLTLAYDSYYSILYYIPNHRQRTPFVVFNIFFFISFDATCNYFYFLHDLRSCKRLRWFLGRFSTKDFCDFHIGGLNIQQQKILFINVLCAVAHGWMKN